MQLNALSVIIGLLGTIALSETISFDLEKTAYGNSATAFLFVVFSCVILRQVYSRISLKDKRGIVFAGGYSFALAFALVAGKELHTVENFALTNIVLWIRILMLTVYFTGPVLYIFQWISERATDSAKETTTGKNDGSKHQKENGRKVYKDFLLTWLVIFLCWIPVFLAFYPGAFVYDAQDEYVQVATREFSTHHPLSHVLMLGGFVCLGNKLFASFNIGIAMYTLVQMAILSGVFAYTICWLRTHLSKRLCAGIALFYGLFPVIPMYAVCSAKDTLFNAAFLLMLVQMMKILEQTFEAKKVFNIKDVVVFVLASSIMMLLRNNGVIAYMILFAGVVVFAVLRWKKERFWVGFAIAMLSAFVLYSGVDKTLAFVLNADDSENQELLTVPIQQLARTWKYSPEVFSKEEQQILFSYIPEDILGIYDADLSDLVKANFDNKKYAEDSSGFWKVWLKGFTHKPVTYLNAWFMTSYGYWYPDTVINVYGGQQRFTFQYGDSSYFGFETEQPGERDSKFPWLEEQYRRMSLELYQQNVPGISMLFSPGFLFWIFLGSLLMCWYRKDYVHLLPMCGIFLLWFSVIPGPTFLVRYVLILWFALPLILFVNRQ